VFSYYNEKEGGNNMKITLISIENKMSKSGAPFWVVKDTNGGSHTIWDKDLSDKLVFGQPMDLVIKEANGFSNIRGIGEKQEANTQTIDSKKMESVNTLPTPQIQTEINKPRTTRYHFEVSTDSAIHAIERYCSRNPDIDWETAKETVLNTRKELIDLFKKQ
jgi:hypothetical protein